MSSPTIKLTKLNTPDYIKQVEPVYSGYSESRSTIPLDGSRYAESRYSESRSTTPLGGSGLMTPLVKLRPVGYSKTSTSVKPGPPTETVTTTEKVELIPSSSTTTETVLPDNTIQTFRTINITPISKTQSVNITPNKSLNSWSGSSNGTNITPMRSSMNVAPTVSSMSVSPIISSMSVGPTVSSRSVSPTVSSRSFSPMISPRSVTPIMSSRSVTSVTPKVFMPSNTDVIIKSQPDLLINQSNDIGIVETMRKTVEDLLSEQGFTVTDKVFLDRNGKTYAKYFKATTDLGQSVYIELDVEGQVKYQPNSRTMVEEDIGTIFPTSTIVPESKMKGMYQCSINGGGCGVIYDCDGEICVMSRPADSVDEPTTVVLKSMSNSTEKQLIVSGVPTAYPVIRLSDALENPLITKASIERSIKAIRNAAVQECKIYYDDARKAVNGLSNALSENYNVANRYTTSLASDIKTLQQYRADYVEMSQKSELNKNNKENFEKVIQMLHDKGDQITELFKLCEALPSMTNRIKQLTSELDDMIKTIKVSDDLNK